MSRRVTRLSARWVVLLAAALPTLARAQQSPAATDEVNQALLRYAFRYEGGNARLISGRVPDDLAPNFYAPPGTRVLGTIVAGSSAVVLATTTTPAESVRTEYTRALGPRGWKTREGRPRGGFVGSMAESPLTLCREGASLHITQRRRATPPHDLHLEYRESSGMCQDQPSARRAEFMAMDEPRFPTLRTPEPPAGRPTQACHSRASSGYRGSMGTGTVVSSDLSAAALLEYFGRQLEASGWSPPGRGGARAVATGTWTRPDSVGASQVALEVTELAPGSGCYDVQMKVAR